MTIYDEWVRDAIVNRLQFSSFYFGRAVVEDFKAGDLELERGDRLEPSKALPDVADFGLMDVPFVAEFWKSQAPSELRLLHETPLMQLEGSTFEQWCIDLLHTWHLGPVATFIAFVIWFILGSKVCASCAHVDTEDGYKLSLIEIRSHLWRFYKEKRAGDPNFRKRGAAVCLKQ